jgi:hypothetical protein
MPAPAKPKKRLEELLTLKLAATVADAKAAILSLSAVANDTETAIDLRAEFTLLVNEFNLSISGESMQRREAAMQRAQALARANV